MWAKWGSPGIRYCICRRSLRSITISDPHFTATIHGRCLGPFCQSPSPFSAPHLTACIVPCPPTWHPLFRDLKLATIHACSSPVSFTTLFPSLHLFFPTVPDTLVCSSLCVVISSTKTTKLSKSSARMFCSVPKPVSIRTCTT